MGRLKMDLNSITKTAIFRLAIVVAIFMLFSYLDKKPLNYYNFLFGCVLALLLSFSIDRLINRRKKLKS